MEISDYVKNVVDKGYLVELKGDAALQAEAYKEQKRQAALANNPYSRGADRVAAANAQALRGDVGGAVTNSGMISQDGVTPVTASSLRPTTQLSVPTVPPSTTAAGITGLAQAQVEQSKLAQAEQAKADAAKLEADSSKGTLQSIQDKIFGVQSSQADLEKQYGLDTKATALTNATNALEKSQRAQTNEIRELEKNQTGMSASALQGEAQRINRQYAFEQADLALIQSAANRDLSTAQSIVDRKIQLQLEPLKTQLDFTKLFYEDNKDALTKEEANLFGLKVKELDQQYNLQKTEAENVGKIQLEAAKNGAPASVIANIGKTTSQAEALKASGGYLNANGVTTITDPTKYSQALSVILGSGTFTKDQKATIANAINNGQDPFTVIKNQAKNIMGQTLATSLDKYETAKTQMQSIDTLLKDYYSNGGKTNIFAGNTEKVINKLGAVDDPKLVEIATNISSALQIYRNAVSGTAYSVQEGKDIASIFPGINKSEGLNTAILSGRMKAFDTTIDAQYRNTLGNTYDDLKKSTVPPTTANVEAPRISNDDAYQAYLEIQKGGNTKPKLGVLGSGYQTPTAGSFAGFKLFK